MLLMTTTIHYDVMSAMSKAKLKNKRLNLKATNFDSDLFPFCSSASLYTFIADSKLKHKMLRRFTKLGIFV